MKRIILFLLVATLVSCKVTFVPTQSQTALDMVQQIQHDANNAFYTSEYNATAYAKVSDGIDSLIVFDKSRAKSGTILKADARIKRMFDVINSEHKTKGEIVATEQDAYRSYFKSVVDPRIILEKSLK